MIEFHENYSDFVLEPKEAMASWLKAIAKKYKYTINELNFIFIGDLELLEINTQFLNHDTLTDIITFDNAEQENVIEGDIYISIDRVKENAKTFEVSFDNELKRVMSHGLLHLVGFKDKNEKDQKEMRMAENEAIELFR